ncbi:MAG: phosphoribosylamine--glycine ligase [Myxococcales bacterium]|nr:phosphoribosylamine--glycine ligase [Myxococcales bacterium]
MAKVLIIGSGGREHALGWKMAQSGRVEEVLFAPGNGGTNGGKFRNVGLDGTKQSAQEDVLALIEKEGIDLTIVGPEAPLMDGLVDFLHQKGVHRVFGPVQAAAALEGDKFFSYDLMKEAGVAQAEGRCCRSLEEAEAAIREMTTSQGIVLKARGLAAGKGVVVCKDTTQALQALPSLVEQFGPDILVSERLTGPEFSVFGLCDGARVIPWEMSFQDHKALLDDDQGPNTGGMGAFGPAPLAPAEMVHQVARDVMTPVVEAFARRGIPYTGFLYAGMMLTPEGPKALEFNVRFGDPECQPAMVMLESELYDILDAAVEGRLEQADVRFRAGAACCVVLAAQGYPNTVKKGQPIEGIEQASEIAGVEVFHAGTRREGAEVLTSGGRVLGVTGYAAEGLVQARQLAYDACLRISTPDGFHYRRDIAAPHRLKRDIHKEGKA